MPARINSEWLSISEVARLLGVHPGTVRNWADDGVLPVYRTEGHHRRFKRSEIELWRRASQQQKAPDPGTALQMAMRQIRIQVAEGRLESQGWYQKLDGEARHQYRMSGSTLVRGLMNYFGSAQAESDLSEAHLLGYEYASRARRYQLSLLEAIQAFLFFRNNLMEGLLAVYSESNVQAGRAWSELFHGTNAFTDKILLSLIDTFMLLEAAHN